MQCKTLPGSCWDLAGFSKIDFVQFLNVKNKKDTIENLKIKNNFIKEILSIWAEVNFDENITSDKQFLEQTLWHNSLIRIDNCPVSVSYTHLTLPTIYSV